MSMLRSLFRGVEMKVNFYTDERINRFYDSGIEYCINIVIGDGIYTIYESDKKINDEIFNAVKKAVIRSIKIYHDSIKIPFLVEVEE